MALITEVPLEQQARDQVILFQAADGQVTLDVRLEADTVWLSQAQMAELFGRERSVITHHVSNVFREWEMPKTSNVHVLHFAGGDACLAGWRQHKVLESRLRTDRVRLEWQKTNVSHVSFQCQQSTDQVSDYCCFNRELC
jgi:hypothetical protein